MVGDGRWLRLYDEEWVGGWEGFMQDWEGCLVGGRDRGRSH